MKAAVVVGLRGNLRAAHDLRSFGGQYNAISRSRTYGAARECVDSYLSERDQRRRDAQAASDRLIEYAGVPGAGQDGRLLDQREVKATTDALRWIHTCQMGWHNSDGQYRRDLLDLLGGFDRQGLPTEHGITMRVSRSGQSWYAWRRLPIGQVLAIGADGPTPNEWLYEGEEPPNGFPGHDRSWAPRDETPPDWR